MITNFWNWIFQSVNAALNTLNTIYQNETFNPFFNLFLVVLATIVIVNYIIKPLIGGGSGSSDKAKRKDNDEE